MKKQKREVGNKRSKTEDGRWERKRIEKRIKRREVGIEKDPAVWH